MRSYHRQGRKTARRWLRWLSAGRVQADDLRATWALWAIAAVMAFSALVQPAPASAAPACPSGRPGPQGECVQRIDPVTVCAWPFALVRVGRVTLCARQTAGTAQ